MFSQEGVSVLAKFVFRFHFGYKMKRYLSDQLFQAAKKTIPGGVNSPVRAFKNVDGDPFFVRRAEGCRIEDVDGNQMIDYVGTCLLYTSPSPRDKRQSRMPSSA